MLWRKGQLPIRGVKGSFWPFGKGEGYNGGDQDYDRPRGNGLYRPKGAGKTVTNRSNHQEMDNIHRSTN
ncbi:hypothetical protein M0R45_009161 [Rubus argutus]|uniref:Uncharacterized protein n=1 Tax=Rubus argutus TaxID=59490 RepID=A0AAW1Y428_RUBAR